MKDYYQILNLPRTASLDQIKARYRELARVHHPDKGGDGSRMVEINEAYAVLSIPEKRLAYDRGSAVPPIPQQWQPGPIRFDMGGFQFDIEIEIDMEQALAELFRIISEPGRR